MHSRYDKLFASLSHIRSSKTVSYKSGSHVHVMRSSSHILSQIASFLTYTKQVFRCFATLSSINGLKLLGKHFFNDIAQYLKGN